MAGFLAGSDGPPWAAAELDAMDVLGAEDRLHTTWHTGSQACTSSVVLPDMAAVFQVYQIEWDKDQIRW